MAVKSVDARPSQTVDPKYAAPVHGHDHTRPVNTGQKRQAPTEVERLMGRIWVRGTRAQSSD